MQRSSELRRTSSLAELVRQPSRHLIVCGLGTSAFDAARLTADGENLFPIDGAMGSAVSVGLGLALAQPQRSVLVITGDGELLMNLGALATAAVQAPPNLSILCIDNGVWGLTGAQRTHTSHGVDLTAVAAACGVARCLTVDAADQIAAGGAALHDATRLTFVRLALDAEPPEPFPFDRDGPAIRRRFRDALAGTP
ncbi:MAG: thiamine pyrophosphate-dependent enzyme [Solirubrobacteraceae bacterium]